MHRITNLDQVAEQDQEGGVDPTLTVLDDEVPLQGAEALLNQHRSRLIPGRQLGIANVSHATTTSGGFTNHAGSLAESQRKQSHLKRMREASMKGTAFHVQDDMPVAGATDYSDDTHGLQGIGAHHGLNMTSGANNRRPGSTSLRSSSVDRMRIFPASVPPFSPLPNPITTSHTSVFGLQIGHATPTSNFPRPNFTTVTTPPMNTWGNVSGPSRAVVIPVGPCSNLPSNFNLILGNSVAVPRPAVAFPSPPHPWSSSTSSRTQPTGNPVPASVPISLSTSILPVVEPPKYSSEAHAAFLSSPRSNAVPIMPPVENLEEYLCVGSAADRELGLDFYPRLGFNLRGRVTR